MRGVSGDRETFKCHSLLIRAAIRMVQILLTDPATAKLKELIEKHGTTEDSFLRVYVAGGGCGGMSYGLALDNKTQEGDEVLHDNGIKVVVDGESAKYLDGSTVDYKETAAGSGFLVSNPNNWSTCGCGKSFSQKGEGAPDEHEGHHHEHAHEA